MRTQVDESEIRDVFWLLVMIVMMKLEPSKSWSRVQRGRGGAGPMVTVR